MGENTLHPFYQVSTKIHLGATDAKSIIRPQALRVPIALKLTS